MEFVKYGLFSKSAPTKIKIFQALAELLETEDFDSITVKQICETAKTGKTTFYAHFQDKYDIIQWFTSLFYDMGVAHIGRTLTWEQGHRITTTGYLQYRDLLVKAFLSSDYNGLPAYCPRRREDNIIDTLVNYKHVEVTRAIRAQVVSLSAGEAAFFNQYLVEEESPDVDECVQALMSVIPPQLYELLEEPVEAKRDSIEEELTHIRFLVHVFALPVKK